MVWQEKFTIDGMAFYLEPETGEVSWAKPEALMSSEEIEGNKGEWVWVPHPTDMWQEARVQKRDEDGTVHVLTQDGSSMAIPANGIMQGTETGGRKQTVPLWELKKSNLRFLEDDLVMLDPVNEAFIIRNLAQRYAKKEIYTWVGAGRSVLVSINPYQDLKLYGDDQIDLHRNKPPNKQITPHVFDIANDSYDSMAFERTNQSILISGESGAGKTEATKQCLKYLAAVAGSDSNVEEKVLVANPLLEAFGNAKTIRNINSSRFGKWMEVYFNRQTAKMQGSRIFNYLLERSRVVHQQANERNYHIFYEMCADPETVAKYSLKKPQEFRYMNQSGCIKVPQFDDVKEYAQVKNAMQKLEFTEKEQESILQLASAVLHLGNIDFQSKQQKGSVDGSEIVANEHIAAASKLLEIPEDLLSKILCYRTIRPKAGADSAVIPLNKSEARTACDSLAMGVYGKLFNWMVGRVNDSLGEPEGRFIGILDIFGFEIFDNSFEQLCINYANEKLQQLFNKTTFKEEEELYKSEGIPFKEIHFIDNQPVLDLVEVKPYGILPALDDECLVPEGSDQKFMNKIEDHHGASKYFQTDSKRRFENQLSFEINHYAGVVKYDASEFMTKNVDTVFDDMYSAMANSSNELLKTIFENSDKRIKTLSFQFRGQLNKLMDTLYTTESRFIRCIKPNDDMSANKFNARSCIEQLRYSGVFEAVDIRKNGYPFRYTHKRFVYRYSCINPGYKYTSKIQGSNYVPRVQEILKVSKQDFSDVQIGNTMVLYRANEYKLLKLLRNLALETLIPKGQSIIRGGINRKYTVVYKNRVRDIQKMINKASDYEGLSKSIEAADPKNNFEPEQLRVFKKPAPRIMPTALRLKSDLEEWLNIEKKMADLKEKCTAGKPDPFYEQLKAIDTKVESELKRQTKLENESKTDFYGNKTYKKPKLTPVQKALHKDMKELIHACILGQLDTRVDKAIKAFNREEIVASLKQADELRHKTPRIADARKMLEEFEILDEDAQKAVKCVSRTMLKEVVENAKKLKQNNDHIKAAQRMLDLDERDFVQAEYERAEAVGDDKRRIHREIRMMEFKYEDADASQYDVMKMANIRTEEEFAKAKWTTKFMGKEALMSSLKVHYNKPIPTSLTKPQVEIDVAGSDGGASPEQKQQIKFFKTEAMNNFKAMLVYMGDKKPTAQLQPNQAASEILERGLRAYNQKDDDTLQEMYVQVIKQLTQNPNQESKSQGLTLLAMMMSVFAPSSAKYQTDSSKPATFDDAIITWVLHNVTQDDRQKYVSALHNVKYGEKVNHAPEPTVLKNQFKELTGKFSLDTEADSGPEDSKISLYLK